MNSFRRDIRMMQAEARYGGKPAEAPDPEPAGMDRDRRNGGAQKLNPNQAREWTDAAEYDSYRRHFSLRCRALKVPVFPSAVNAELNALDDPTSMHVQRLLFAAIAERIPLAEIERYTPQLSTPEWREKINDAHALMVRCMQSLP